MSEIFGQKERQENIAKRVEADELRENFEKNKSRVRDAFIELGVYRTVGDFCKYLPKDEKLIIYFAHKEQGKKRVIYRIGITSPEADNLEEYADYKMSLVDSVSLDKPIHVFVDVART